MKTLYESILDDDDVLIGDVKKTSNEFDVILSLCKEGDFDRLTEMCNDGLLDKFIKDILYVDPKELKIDGHFYYYGLYAVEYFMNHNKELVLLRIKYSLRGGKLYISIPNNEGITNFQYVEKIGDQLNDMYNKRNKITRSIKKLGFTKNKTQIPYIDLFEKN